MVEKKQQSYRGVAPALGKAYTELFLQEINILYRGVAQLVARLLWEQDVGSSSLFTPTIKRVIPFGIALFIFEKQSFSPYILNTIRRLPALGTTRDRVRGTMQGVNGAPEKRKLLRGLEPQRSYELFD